MRYENGEKVFNILMIRAVYGYIESALLWYNLISKTIEGLSFEINPYDICVSNKVIEGTQCTLAWYADDDKLSHRNPEVNQIS